MNIQFDAEKKVFKLDTANTSYVIALVDEENFIGHAYYGAKISDTDVSYLMRTAEPPFVPSKNNRDRSSFFDAFPMEYPGNGVGDYRESAVEVLDDNCHTAVNFCYTGHKIYHGKPALAGMPATFAPEEKCMTLELFAEDPVLKLKAVFLYSIFDDVDAVVRSVQITNKRENI